MAPDTNTQAISRVDMTIPEALTFDDVLIVPGYSQVLPNEADTRTRFTRTIELNIPLISSQWTPSPRALWRSRWPSSAASASSIRTWTSPPSRRGPPGQKIRIRHGRQSTDHFPDQTLADARALMSLHRISGFPWSNAAPGAWSAS